MAAEVDVLPRPDGHGGQSVAAVGLTLDEADVRYNGHAVKLGVQFPDNVSENNTKWMYLPGGYHGDQTLDVHVHGGCGLVITTPSYIQCKGDGRTRIITHNYTVDNSSLLAVLPQPTVLQRRASIHLQKHLCIDEGSNVILLDWFTSGRQALEEHWELESCICSTKVSIGGCDVFTGSLNLTNTEQVPLSHILNGVHVIGSLYITGPNYSGLRRTLPDLINEFSNRYPQNSYLCESHPLYTAAIGADLVVIKFTTRNIEEVTRMLQPLIDSVSSSIGGNPFDIID